MSGIYLHVPFCSKACHYCDFHFSTNLSKVEEMVQAMKLELHKRSEFLPNQSINTIYFGGGTPSLLSSRQLSVLLNEINKIYHVNRNAEITIEVNPENVEHSKFHDLKEIGFNRISMGVQTFDDAILKSLNRSHNSNKAIEAFKILRKCGFENISIDLIIATALSTQKSLQNDLNTIATLNPEHISTYILTLEEQTVFGNLFKKGLIDEIDENKATTHYLEVCDFLRSRNYEHYEVSNFCRKGHNSKHNMNYWNGTPYLGIGPSAHSFCRDIRYFNKANNADYLRGIVNQNLDGVKENLSIENRYNEYVMTRLRTMGGIIYNEVDKITSNQLRERAGIVKSVYGDKLITLSQDGISLTEYGFLFSDEIAREFFL